jgi:hypothetical protein
MKSKTALNPSNNLQYQPHRLIDGPSCDVAMLWLRVGQLSNPLQISLGVLEVERLDYRSMDLVVARGPHTMTWCSFQTNRWPTANVWRGMKGLGSVEWASNLVPWIECLGVPWKPNHWWVTVDQSLNNLQYLITSVTSGIVLRVSWKNPMIDNHLPIAMAKSWVNS